METNSYITPGIRTCSKTYARICKNNYNYKSSKYITDEWMRKKTHKSKKSLFLIFLPKYWFHLKERSDNTILIALRLSYTIFKKKGGLKLLISNFCPILEIRFANFHIGFWTCPYTTDFCTSSRLWNDYWH